MSKIFRWFLVSVVLVLLTACGGGGTQQGGDEQGSAIKNTAPSAKNISLQTNTEVSTLGSFSVSDAEDTYLKYYTVSQPEHGTLKISEDNKVFSYIPKVGFSGQDTFSYKAYDGKVYSNVAKVTIDVAPVAALSTDTTAPSRATILSINSPSSNKITLFWIGSEDSETPPSDLRYEVHCSTQQGFVPEDSTKKIAIKGALEADVEGLDEETLYYVRIKTLDSGGNEAVSSEMNITTAARDAVVVNHANSVKKADDLFLHDAVMSDTTINYPKTDKNTAPQVGDILVGDSTSRTLRKIESIQTKDNKIILSTQNATMADVFDTLKLDTKTVLYDLNKVATLGSKSLKKFKSYSYAHQATSGYSWGSQRFVIEQPVQSIKVKNQPNIQKQAKKIGRKGSYVIISSPSEDAINIVAGEALNIELTASLNTGTDSDFDSDDKSRQIESFELVSVEHDGESDDDNFGFSMSTSGAINPITGRIRFIATNALASTKPYILTVRAKAKWYDTTGIDTWEEDSEEVTLEVTVLTPELDATEGFNIKLVDDGKKTTYSLPIIPDFSIKNEKEHNATVTASAGINIDFSPTLVTNVNLKKKYVKVLVGGRMQLDLSSAFSISGDFEDTYEFNLTKLDRTFINVYTAGPIPIYQRIDVTWKMDVIPKANAKIEASSKMTKVFNVNFGIECKNSSCEDLSSSDASSNYVATVKVGAEASLEVRLVPEVKVSFYESAAASITVEPWVKGTVSAEGEAIFASDFNNYDAWLSYTLRDLRATVGLDSYVNADLTVFGWNLYHYPSDADKKKLFGIETDIFSLPTLGIETLGNDALFKDRDIALHAQTTDGKRSNVDTSSIKWYVHPANTAIVTKSSGNPRNAILNISDFGLYTVYFVANSSQVKGIFGQQRAKMTIDMRDDDGDQMADRWEEAYGLNPLDGSEGSEDKDGDGYSNLLEYQQGTNPSNDTDTPDVPKDMGDHDAPVFTSAQTASVNENQTAAITLVATDASDVIYGLLDGLDASSFSVDTTTGVVTFRAAPDYESGKHSYSFRASATDSAGNQATQEVTITILDVDETVPDVTPPVITITGPNPASVTVGTSYSDAGATATDDKDGSRPVSIVRNTIDTSVVGEYEIIYHASDTSGNEANATRVVQVVASANTPPTANAGADQTVEVGEVVNLVGSNSTDTDGYIVDYNWTESGSTIYDQADGEVTNLSVGEHIITLTVTDDKGAKDEDNITVVVNPASTVLNPLENKVIYWSEEVPSTYTQGTSYTHKYMLALYSDRSCRIVSLNVDIDKEAQDKEQANAGSNQIDAVGSALEVIECDWDNTDAILTLDTPDTSIDIALNNKTLGVGDVIDPDCTASGGCKVSKVAEVLTIAKEDIADHALHAYTSDGHEATWYFKPDNTLQMYYEGNTSIQFDGQWALNGSYLDVQKDGNTVARIDNSLLRTVDKMSTYIDAYISGIDANTTQIPNTPPTAQATATPTTTTQGEIITFDGTSSSDSDGSIISYIWVEDNTILSAQPTFTEENLSVGVHTITLIVTDNDDSNATDTVTVTVQSAAATSMRVKKTGQTKSYDADGNEVMDGSIKDDGFYQKGVTPSYSRANEVVTDHITGLQWQDDTAAKTVTKQWVTQANYDAGNYSDTSGDTATTYCANLSLDGGGWRLPTVQELQSIVVDGALNPSMDTAAFVNYFTADYYWSSSTISSNVDNAWSVNFNGGNTDCYAPKSRSYYVRCVR